MLNLNNKRFVEERFGEMSQIGGLKEYTLKAGKSKGVECVEVNNGVGLRFTIVKDRGLDIAWCDYKGFPVSYMSKTGVVSPNFFEVSEKGFFKNFYAGLLTTCGLRNIGPYCVDENEKFGLHGNLSNTPAEEICVFGEWKDENYVMNVRGKMRESNFFGENIILTRSYKIILGENKIYLCDEIENIGFKKEPIMILYHCNIGYPFVSKESKFFTSSKNIISRDSEAEKGLKKWNEFQEPTANYKEQVFYHKIDSNIENYGCIYNSNLENGLGFYVKFKNEFLSDLIQWKMMGQNEYVLGIEPSSNFVGGRDKLREENLLKYINPGEKKIINLEFGIINSEDELKKLVKF